MRDGKLVRMERRSRLPDRCVFCNEPAHGRHVRRRLYQSYWAWNLGAVLAVLAALAGIVRLQQSSLAFTFWLFLAIALTSMLVIAVTYLYARKSFTVELSLCGTHRRTATVARVVDILALLTAIVWCLLTYRDPPMELFAAMVVALVLHVGLSLVSVQRIRLKRLSAEHAWLGGTGEPFRAALPERPF